MERMQDQKLKFHHFSHEHPLEQHTNSPPKQSRTCAGCKLVIQSDKDYYSCATCPFFLHQVCYNMPRKRRHPAHPNHYLNLHPSLPSSTTEALNCQACGNLVTGFYYDCAECGLYYHSLCSALPFSISTSSHPHTLKLSFSPPFDLCCDLCNEPGNDGWLYRCHICEFDTHISCAISNQTGLEPPKNSIPPLPTNAFSRAPSFGINVAENYYSEGDELLQLVRQKVFRGNYDSIDEKKVGSALTGWDERLYSPKQDFNVTISKFGNGGSHQKDAGLTVTSLNPNDPATPVSEDMTMTPSHQFSDAYFSIDLAQSYPSYGQKIQGKTESDHQGFNATSYVQGTFSYSDSTNVNGPGGNYSNKIGQENRLNEAFLIRGDTLQRMELGSMETKRKAGEIMGRSTIGSQSTKSDTERSAPSYWQLSLLACCNGHESSTY